MYATGFEKLMYKEKQDLWLVVFIRHKLSKLMASLLYTLLSKLNKTWKLNESIKKD